MESSHFIKNIQQMLSNILDDILNLRNIEKYVVAGFAIVFAILGLFGDIVADDYKLSIILAALGLLVFSTSQRDREKPIERLLNKRKDLPPLSESLKNTHALWVYAPSATNFLEDTNLSLIEENILSKKKGSFRVVIQNPDETEAINILIKHLDEGITRQNNQPMREAIAKTKSRLEKLAKRDHTGKFSYGFLDYGLGFSLVAFNPEHHNGYIILEMHAFQNEYTHDRMHIRIDRHDSEFWFDYWINQFNMIWEKAKNKYQNHTD